MNRITNARKDYLDKISTEIVKNHDIIGMEDLSSIKYVERIIILQKRLVKYHGHNLKP